MTYWIVVGSPDDFDIAINRGFDMFGFKSTRRGQTATMEPGDKLDSPTPAVREPARAARLTTGHRHQELY